MKNKNVYFYIKFKKNFNYFDILNKLECFVFRFGLSSTESGLIASCYEIAGTLVVLFVTYVGGRGHKPLWVAWGIFLIGLSGVIFSLPHFIASRYSFTKTSHVCGDLLESSCQQKELKSFRYVHFYNNLNFNKNAPSFEHFQMVIFIFNNKQCPDMLICRISLYHRIEPNFSQISLLRSNADSRSWIYSVIFAWCDVPG